METKKPWIQTARKFLQASFAPLPHELNELDWKEELSTKTEKLSHHLSAFANTAGGGFLVFGIDADGKVPGISRSAANETIAKVANIARAALEPPQTIDHFIDEFQGKPVLFIHIQESPQKPAHLRGKGIEYH